MWLHPQRALHVSPLARGTAGEVRCARGDQGNPMTLLSLPHAPPIEADGMPSRVCLSSLTPRPDAGPFCMRERLADGPPRPCVVGSNRTAGSALTAALAPFRSS